MTDDTKYTSSIAQVVESSGNLVNSVRKPGFVLGLVALIGIFFIAYKYLENQRESLLVLQKISLDSKISREEVQKQTNLFVKQNEILKSQGN
jgi:hypothetical protein